MPKSSISSPVKGQEDHALLTPLWFSRIMQITEKFNLANCFYPYLELPQFLLHFASSVACSYIFLLRCSVFKVQSFWFFKTRSKCSNLTVQALPSGFKPPRRVGGYRPRKGPYLGGTSPPWKAHLVREANSISAEMRWACGGPEWTRTTDLTIISRVL